MNAPLFDHLEPEASLEEQFWEFHSENPHVYTLFCRFAQEALDAGRSRIGAKLIFERMRWYTRIETEDAAGFKCNNNYTAFYARLWLRDNPEHEGFFVTRRQRHAG